MLTHSIYLLGGGGYGRAPPDLMVEHLKVMAALSVEPAYASLSVEPPKGSLSVESLTYLSHRSSHLTYLTLPGLLFLHLTVAEVLQLH